jgi:hypothetical protein
VRYDVYIYIYNVSRLMVNPLCFRRELQIHTECAFCGQQYTTTNNMVSAPSDINILRPIHHLRPTTPAHCLCLDPRGDMSH